MQLNRNEVIDFINKLKGYQGYVQFSNRPIEDIFLTKSDIHVDAKNGFVYEAHFFNGNISISIKQINAYWIVAQTEITAINEDDVVTYIGIKNSKIKMLQIWNDVEDPLCEGLKVKKFNKALFIGFSGGEK